MNIDDAALVRAPRWLVHRRLAELGRWSWWWPGLHVLHPGGSVADGLGPVAGRDRGPLHVDLQVRRPGRPGRRLRLALVAHGHRVDLGLHLLVTGDVTARSEFWFEDATGGTLVHHVGQVDERARWSGPTWREAIRRGLWALDARVAAEVRTAVGILDDAGQPARSPRQPPARRGKA